MESGTALTQCLSEDEALRFVEGEATTSSESIQNHLDVCPICRVLVGEAVLAMGHAEESPETSPASRRRTLTSGTVILRRYEIVRFLARGGMGEVYEARDTVLGEVVALKTLVATALDDSYAMNRLRQEVRIARQVTHANVCRILEFGFHRPNDAAAVESIPFLTMEFLRGETLEQRLARAGRLSPSVVVPLLEQMIAGLKAIHAAGIVHRDLKPANVFVLPGTTERVVLMDFGLARALERERGAGSGSGPAVVGTVDYMAPEQVEGKPATPGFDIYALGLVVFEMLTGRKPFAGETPLASAVDRLTRRPPRPSEDVAGLHPTWDEIVTRCLATDPSKRFASVDEVGKSLSSLSSDRLGSSRRKMSMLVAGVLGASVALAWLATRNEVSPNPSAPLEIVVRPADTEAPSHVNAPAPTTELASPPPTSAASVLPRATTAPKRDKARRPTDTGSSTKRAPSATENRDEMFAPRPTRPRHPDDVINPFENQP